MPRGQWGNTNVSRSITDQDAAMVGTFPRTCSVCGVECETVDELADPDHHEWK